MAESDDQYDALGAIYERPKHIPTAGLRQSPGFGVFTAVRPS